MKFLTDRMKLQRKDIPMLVLQIVVAIALLAFFIPKAKSIDFAPLYVLSHQNLIYLFFLKLVTYLITSYRLSLILKNKKMLIQTPWVFAVNNIGLLVSYLVPSSVLSDLGKIFFFRKFHTESAKILVAMFIDRLSGLLCIMFVLAGASTVLKIQNPLDFDRLFFEAKLIKTTAFVGLTAASIVGLIVVIKVKTLNAFLRKHFSFLSFSLGSKIFSLSVISHLLFVFLIFEVSRLCAPVKIKMLDAALLFPMSTLATTVPTTPGSIGVGQMIYKYLIDTLTVTNTDSGVLIFTLLQILDIPLLILAVMAAFYLSVIKKKA